MGAAEGVEGLEDFQNVFGPGAGELRGEFGGRDGRGGGVQGGFHGLNTLGEGFGPRRFRFALPRRGLGGFGGLQVQGALRAGLILRAQPVNDAALFLRCPFRVQFHEALQNLGIGQGGGLAVGGEDGGVEIVVELLEDGHQPLVVNELFLVGERFPGAEFFEDVVKAGEGEAVLRLHALAVRVEFFGQLAECKLSPNFINASCSCFYDQAEPCTVLALHGKRHRFQPNSNHGQ